jgi:ATP-dependent Clp protease ATP-binding subunit ClpA/ATP-dependent Clp protease ATP-binding subunit ClpC
MTFTIGVFQQRQGADELWYALVPPPHHGHWVRGPSEARLRTDLVDRLRKLLDRVDPADHELFHLHAGTRLLRVHVDVGARGPDGAQRRIGGTFPFVLEPRWLDAEKQTLFVWHPLHPEDWFTADDPAQVAELAGHFARHAWTAIDDDELVRMKSTGKERLGAISFSATGKTLLDKLPKRDEGRQRAALGRRRHDERVLESLAVDQTSRAVDGTLPVGVPREPYRTKLQHLLGGRAMRSTVLVGRPGAGKTTLLNRWVADRLTEDGFALNRNLDDIHHVWKLSGKRLIAGMSYLGDWEERVLAVIRDAQLHAGILWIEDLHLFGRLGQSRQSERALADLFRGPIARGALTIVATLTPEQLQRLEDDAPALASLLVRVHVAPASNGETQALLLHETRAIEEKRLIEIHPFTARAAIELGGALYPWAALPGTAIDLLRKVVDGAAGAEIGPDAVVAHLARATGLPPHLITLDAPLDPDEVRAHFARRVHGQPEAIGAAADVVLRVRAGLADPGRPLAVHLYTGPTGTGKTELATALAEYLYGDRRRLLRFDMSELSGPDAVGRLVGDRWEPRGLLTERVREQPFAVVLLDEIEKAHPSVLALLLQLFDEGRLTDAAGDTASFAHCVIVMTSNLGARPTQPIGFADDAATRTAILAEVARAVRDFFLPELFNRIDRVVRFSPLTGEVAAQIVDKELAKLLARRGLRERNVFVYAGAAVKARAVAEAFDTRWGARTVKRWLEDTIGSLLADDVGTAGPARMRIVRLFEDAGRIALASEPMTEQRPPPGAAWRLEPLAELPALRLADAAVDARRRARAFVEADPFRRAVAAARSAASDLLYYAEAFVDRVRAIAGLAHGAPSSDDASHDPDVEHDLAARRKEQRQLPRAYPGGEGRVVTLQNFDPRSVAGRGPSRRAIDRDQVLGDVAHLALYERHAGELADPDAHAVTVELTSVGHGTRGTPRLGVWWFLALYARPEWFDEAAVRLADGSIVTLRGDDRARLTDLIGRVPVHAVVVLRDLFVRAKLLPEHGSHVEQSLAGEPEIVRVAVSSGARAPRATLEAHRAAAREFERALDAGGPIPHNPEALLPVARAMSYAEPRRLGEPYEVELEDFTTGWSAKLEVPNLVEAVQACWRLRWSRE